MKVSKRKLADILRKAAKVLEKNGKCEGVYAKYDGSFCLVGAMANVYQGYVPGDSFVAGGARTESDLCGAELREALGVVGSLGDIFLFSDSNDTATVVKAMRRAAYRLEHGGKDRPKKRPKTFADRYPKSVIQLLEGYKV